MEAHAAFEGTNGRAELYAPRAVNLHLIAVGLAILVSALFCLGHDRGDHS
jgi:hypothetical protein